MMYQKYDAYKDSGVQWLGNIPNDWEVVRFRDICTFSKGLNITKENLQDTGALLHKDLKCKAPLIEPNLRRNLGKWST